MKLDRTPIIVDAIYHTGKGKKDQIMWVLKPILWTLRDARAGVTHVCDLIL